MEYLVRAARVTDIDRVVTLSDQTMQMDHGESPLGAADLMRQLVYLPQASIVVAESQRIVVGGAILALRPSVPAGGYVGTIDLLVTDVVMPQMNGRLLSDRLRAERPDIEVLFMSGYTDNAIDPGGILDPGVAFLQ